jgi:hypothetical protein
LAAEVDVNRLELVGGDRAQLSPLRYWTNESASKVPARFGLPSAASAQELFIYTLISGQRMQVTIIQPRLHLLIYSSILRLKKEWVNFTQPL